MEEQIEIIDESGDKKYFTQLPSYILNHSTANEHSLYWLIKRYAGENGICFASKTTLMKKMGVGRKTFNKSLDYLLDKNWIRFIGIKEVMTIGGLQKINTYKVVDIWKLNINHYEIKGGAERTPLATKGGLEEQRGGAERTTNNIYVNNNHIKNSELCSQIGKLMDIFYKINPTLNWGNKTTRKASEDLIKKFGLDATLKMAEQIISVQGKPYAPICTTPYQMKEKLAQFKIYFDGLKNKQSNFIQL